MERADGADKKGPAGSQPNPWSELQRQMASAAAQSGFSRLVVADDRGFVVIASDASTDCEWLAAVAPIDSSARASIPGAGSVAVTPFELFGERLFLCGVRSRPDADLRGTSASVSRLLAA